MYALRMLQPGPTYGCRKFYNSVSTLGYVRNQVADKAAADNGQRVRIYKKTGEPWVSTIGLEVHAQIATRSKLFSGAATNSRAPSNTQVSLFDASTPGTLPVLNRGCVEAGIKTALALNCKINNISTFDRKHYFYADLPAGYQITQQRRPLAVKGRLDFMVLKSSTVPQTYASSSGIVQLQLEQDSGKSLHDLSEEKSLIDLNRCGTGLMEIVFEPDLFDGEEAAALIKELALILQALGTCTCQMEEGALRVDANISVRRPSEPLGIRTEIKNLNSVRSMVNAIEFEISRQIESLSNGQIIENETRSFDPALKMTLTMRDKEAKQDYRFMPEPNLPPLRLEMKGVSGNPNVLSVATIGKSLPELPEDLRQKIVREFSLPLEFAVRFVNDPPLLNFFLEAVKFKPKNFKVLANLVLIEVERWRSKKNLPLEQLRFRPEHFARASNLKSDGILTHHLINKSLDILLHNDKYSTIDQVIEDMGWLQTFRNPHVIEPIVDDAIEESPKLVRKYLNTGNQKVFDLILQTVIKKSLDVDMIFVSNRLKEKLDLMKQSSGKKQ